MAPKDCPRCKDAMKVVGKTEVEIDLCSGCQGIFLDKGEMNTLVKVKAGDLEYCTAVDEVLETEDGKKAVECPACDAGPMRKVEFCSYSTIVLDYCDGCGGFWLDGGELDDIRLQVTKLEKQSPTFWYRFSEFLRALPF